MSKNVNHIQHIKSNVVENGKPKLPLASALVEGELAVNYAEGYETISLKNSSGDIVTFSSDEYYTSEKLGSGFTGENSAKTVTEVIEENEEITSAALNDLETRKLDASAYTPTDLSNYYTKDETSGATEIASALNVYADSVKYNSTSHTVEFYHGTTAGTKVFEFDASDFIIDGMVDNVEIANVESGSSIIKCLVVTFNTDAGKQDIDIPVSDIFDPDIYYTKDEIDNNELVIASALNDLNVRKLDASAYTPTDLSNYYTKSETSGATEISDALADKQDISGMSAYTLVVDLEEKLGSAFTGDNSAKTVTDVIEENEEITSAALNDLDERKLDASAYTPTDLSNYYTKSQTSGATEISNALTAKTDLSVFNTHSADTDIHVTAAEKEGWDAKADKTWVEDKLGSAFTGANSAVTVTEYLEENERVTSAALNDLEANKLDASAYTPTDLSNYYTKSQTSGATEISDALNDKQDASGMTAYTTNAHFDEKLGSAFTGTNSAVTVTEALDNVEIDIDQVIDSGTSASTNAVATQAVYSAVTDNELVWTNAYVALSAAVSSHTANTSIHRVDKVSKSQISSNTTVSCPADITGATNDGAQTTVIYENTSTTTDYTVTVASGYKTPNGGSMVLTCPANGFCKVTYINIGGTIYASGN